MDRHRIKAFLPLPLSGYISNNNYGLFMFVSPGKCLFFQSDLENKKSEMADYNFNKYTSVVTWRSSVDHPVTLLHCLNIFVSGIVFVREISISVPWYKVLFHFACVGGRRLK